MEVLGILQIGHGMNLIIMEGMNMVWYSTGTGHWESGMMLIRGAGILLLFVNINIDTN